MDKIAETEDFYDALEHPIETDNNITKTNNKKQLYITKKQYKINYHNNHDNNGNNRNIFQITTEHDIYKKYKSSILGGNNPTENDDYCESYKLNNIKIIKIFVEKIKYYALNSPMNDEHIRYFRDTIKREKTIYLLDRISLVQYNNYETNEAHNLLELINGHHRIEGLRNFFKHIDDLELDNYNICIRLDIYYVSNPESKETRLLFRNFNNVRPQKTNWCVKDMIHLLITKLNDNFNLDKFVFIKDSDKRVHKPSIYKKEFSIILEKHLEMQQKTINKEIDDTMIDIEKIITKFITLNDSIKFESIEWFNSKEQTELIDSPIKINAYQKAKNAKCFLGLIKLEELVKQCINL